MKKKIRLFRALLMLYIFGCWSALMLTVNIPWLNWILTTVLVLIGSAALANFIVQE